MKKLFLLFAALAVAAGMSAQEKGDMSVGGVVGLSISSQTTKTVAGTDVNVGLPQIQVGLSLNPQFNYFVIKGLELSGGLDYSCQITPDNTGSTTVHIAKMQVGASYFVPVVRGVFYYAPGISFGLGGGSWVTKADDGFGTITTTTTPLNFAFDFTAHVGKFDVRVNRLLGLEFCLLDISYSTLLQKSTVADVKVKNSLNTFAMGLDFGTQIGLKFYF